MHQQFQGTPDYASTRGLLNKYQGAQDDLEALAYCLLELWNGEGVSRHVCKVWWLEGVSRHVCKVWWMEGVSRHVCKVWWLEGVSRHVCKVWSLEGVSKHLCGEGVRMQMGKHPTLHLMFCTIVHYSH